MTECISVEIQACDGALPSALRALRGFLQTNSKWTLTKNVEDAAILNERDSLLIDSEKIPHVPAAGISLWAKKRRAGKYMLYSVNVVPKEMGQLTRMQYNMSARAFATDLRRYLRSTRSSVKVTMSPESIGLKEIIQGSRTREFFQRYLNQFPRSYHPCDVERLDSFICAIHRYKSAVKSHAIYRYLMEDLHWSQRDAAQVRDRIETGLEVLKVYRRFR